MRPEVSQAAPGALVSLDQAAYQPGMKLTPPTHPLPGRCQG